MDHLLLPPSPSLSLPTILAPTSKDTLKPFAPPRSSQEEDSSAESSEGDYMCPVSPMPPTAVDLPTPGTEEDVLPESPQGTPLSREIIGITKRRKELVIEPYLKTVARTPSPPRAMKRRRIDTTPEATEVQVVVTSRFFNQVPMRRLDSDLLEAARVVRSSLPPKQQSYPAICSTILGRCTSRGKVGGSK